MKNQLVLVGYLVLIVSCVSLSFSSDNLHVEHLSKAMAFVILLTTFRHINQTGAVVDK